MADVIICLGDVFYTLKTVESMKLRTEKAVELYKQKKASKIIFSGGFKTRKDLSEAKFMTDIAIKQGLPSENIILEERANTTVGNAYYSKEIMNERGFKSAIVVTAPHHLSRVRHIFKRIIPDKKLEFEKCKNNLGFFEAIPCYVGEIWSLIKLKIRGIDFSRL